MIALKVIDHVHIHVYIYIKTVFFSSKADKNSKDHYYFTISMQNKKSLLFFVGEEAAKKPTLAFSVR